MDEDKKTDTDFADIPKHGKRVSVVQSSSPNQTARRAVSSGGYTYEPIPEMAKADIENAIRENNLEILYLVPLSAALHSQDPEWAQEICLSLSDHHDPNVRGNAILGFGYIARIHRVLHRDRVQPIIEDGLHDADEYVRSHAHDAADDVEHFLKWRIRRLRSVK